MSQTTLQKEGCLDADTRNALNEMFTELYAGQAGSASATAAYPKTTSGVQTLLAAAAVDRTVIVSVQVTQVFADGGGSQPTFSIGQTGSAAKFAATARFTDAAAGATFSFAGTLTAGTDLIVTAVAAVGAGTGALAVTVQAQ